MKPLITRICSEPRMDTNEHEYLTTEDAEDTDFYGFWVLCGEIAASFARLAAWNRIGCSKLRLCAPIQFQAVRLRRAISVWVLD